MIYIVIGGSRAGKSTFIKNSFMKGMMKYKKDLIKYCETENAYVLGNYEDDTTRAGLDRVSRAQIKDIAPQVERLYSESGKDIVLDGGKATARSIFNALLNKKYSIKLFYIKCSPKVSIACSKADGIPTGEQQLKSMCTKAERIFWEYKDRMNGEIINTDKLSDFKNFSIHTYKNLVQTVDDVWKDKKFAVFILTHGRADNMITLKPLQVGGYTGKIYFIIDNEDEQADLYKKKFGEDNVIVFDKQVAYDRPDTMDNFNEHRAIIYARNECWRIAKKLGLDYFLMLDDDYESIDYRWPEHGKLKTKAAICLDRIFMDMLDFLDASGADTVAFAQGGDFVGGLEGGSFNKRCLRKAMNSFFCRTDRPIQFAGTMNEDVVTYTTLSSRGHLFLSITSIMIRPRNTQSLKGGMTEAYLESGTYLKSFYAVMSMPSACKVAVLNTSHSRIHHKVAWGHCCPMILPEGYKK